MKFKLEARVVRNSKPGYHNAFPAGLTGTVKKRAGQYVEVLWDDPSRLPENFQAQITRNPNTTWTMDVDLLDPL